MANQLGSWYASFVADMDGFIAPMKQAQQEADELVKRLKPIRQELTDLGEAMVAAGAIVTATIGEMVDKTVELGEQMFDLAQKTGVGVEQLQEFGYAAEQSGANIDDVSSAMKKLSVSAVAAADNVGGKQAAAFNALGISVTDANGNVKSANQLMLDMANAFQGTQDGAEKTAVAVALMGKNGTALIPMLDRGSAGLTDLGKELESVNAVMSGPAAEASKQFSDAWNLNEQAVAGLGMGITTALLPALTDLVNFVTPIIVDLTRWANAHPELIRLVTLLAGELTGAGGLLIAIAGLTVALPKLGAAFELLSGSFLLSTVGAFLALGTAAYMFSDQLSSAILTVGSFIDNGLAKLMSAAASAANALGLSGLSSSLKEAQFSMEESAKSYADMANVFSLGPPVMTENTKKVNDYIEAQKIAIAMNNGGAAAAKKLKQETDNLVNSVTEEGTKGQALVAALQILIQRHVDMSAIVDKLGKQTITYNDQLVRMGQSVPTVVSQVANLAAALNQENDANSRAFEAWVKIGDIQEKNAAQMQQYASASGAAMASMKQADDNYVKNLQALTALQDQYLKDSSKDEVTDRINAINEQLKADANYKQFRQDAAAALLQTQKEADDAAAAYYQTTLDIQSAMDAGYDQSYINGLVELGKQQEATWKTWAAEHEQIEKTSESNIAANQKSVMNQWTQMTNKMSSDFASAVSDTLVSGKSFSAGLTKIFQDLATNIIKIMVQGVFQQLMSGFTSLLGGMSGGLSGLFGGVGGGLAGSAGGGLGGLLGGGLSALGGLFGIGGTSAALAGAGGAGDAALGASYGFGSAGAASSGGLLSTLGGLATNPITIAAAAALGVGLLINHFVGQGRKTANQFVQQVQNPFGSQLESLVNAFDASNANGSLTLDQAQQAETSLTSLIQSFTSAASQFASQGGENQTVVNQAWNTMTTDFGSNFQKIYDDFNNAIAKLQASQSSATTSSTSTSTATTTAGLTVSSNLTNDAVTALSAAITSLTDAMNTLVAHISPTGLLPATGLANSASQIFADAVTNMQGIFTELETKWDQWMTKLSTTLTSITPAAGANGPGPGTPMTVNVNYQLQDGAIQINGVDLSTLNIRDLIETQFVSDAGNDTRGFGTQLKAALGIA